MYATFLRLLVIGLFLCSTLFVTAQENKFLDRGYWKTNPSIEQVEKDIATGNDVAELNNNFFDGVTYAILEEVDNKTIEHLIGKKGNDVNKLTHDGRTYIFWAAYRNNLALMKFLFANGAKTNITDSHGYSVVNFAANTGQINLKIYDFLLQNGADINATTHSGANALLLVSPFVQDYTTIAYFLNKGLSLESTDDKGNTIFHYAAKGGNIKVLNKLIAQGVSYKALNNEGANAILMASIGTRGKQNTLTTYTYLESLGIAPNITDKKGRNPLHAIASRNKDLDVYRYFIEKGVSVNQQDANGTTPFMNAARRNSLEVVTFLSELVDDINIKNEKGLSALAMAVNDNNAEVVSFLLEKKAEVSTTDKKGNTLAFYLANNFNSKSPETFEKKLQLLQDAGLEISKEQADGNTLLHLAAKDNNLSFLKRLEAFNMDINQKNNEGNTPLHMAAMTSENEEILKYLIAQGADKNVKTDFDETVYDLAMENELLQAGEVELDFLKK